MPTTYLDRKNAAREKAKAWLEESSQRDVSYAELADVTAYFKLLAKRYGLTEEFQENGII